MQILSVVGNRPQFIKSGPLSLALQNRAVEEIVLHTGQHYDHELSQVFFDELGLEPPKYRLETGPGTHAEQTARMLPGIEAAIVEEGPDIVLVYGDTNSTLAGALAAAKLQVPVAHVEAGLRSFDRTMPEELNRVLVDRVSQLLFAPSDAAVANLDAEGITAGVHQVGDVMLDANLRLAPIARQRSQALELVGVEPGAYALTTVHREANTREPNLGRIVEALNALEEPVVVPLHPRTANAIEAQGHRLGGHIHPHQPAGYLDFAALASQSRVILTDSGGVQKEAYWYEVPCVTLRDTTEWGETVELGWNRLVGSDPSAIAAAVRDAAPGATHPPLYGDGHAADLIADVVSTIRPN
ncbi:MAG TPA: UDP-N-acetylglucosamine 2-epimerase (non-hydrolyzing) [Gaiellaceae bacterium]|jgi:UDP-GlcNAc3NAcA epimerase|nr:UDP-N-acetylglucosamine 2-epimerase (non-hydrolyzing) [Gaiellaceae bacterium]